jgi:hypothetical protein
MPPSQFWGHRSSADTRKFMSGSTSFAIVNMSSVTSAREARDCVMKCAWKRCSWRQRMRIVSDGLTNAASSCRLPFRSLSSSPFASSSFFRSLSSRSSFSLRSLSSSPFASSSFFRALSSNSSFSLRSFSSRSSFLVLLTES